MREKAMIGTEYARAHERLQMVVRQLRSRGIADERVLDAMGRVPRHAFVPPELSEVAYADRALPLQHDQTISQPYMVARSCELAALQPDDRVLEVGAGSGYQAAVLSCLARHVVAIEIIPELAERARQTLSALDAGVTVVCGDGSRGYPDAAPYDAILVAAGAPEVPGALQAQLAQGGRLVIPVGSRSEQRLRVVTRHGDAFEQVDHDACVFVPLRGVEGF